MPIPARSQWTLARSLSFVRVIRSVARRNPKPTSKVAPARKARPTGSCPRKGRLGSSRFKTVSSEATTANAMAGEKRRPGFHPKRIAGATSMSRSKPSGYSPRGRTRVSPRRRKAGKCGKLVMGSVSRSRTHATQEAFSSPLHALRISGILPRLASIRRAQAIARRPGCHAEQGAGNQVRPGGDIGLVWDSCPAQKTHLENRRKLKAAHGLAGRGDGAIEILLEAFDGGFTCSQIQARGQGEGFRQGGDLIVRRARLTARQLTRHSEARCKA